MLTDPKVPLTTSWYFGNCPGCKDNVASEESRGGQADRWNAEMIIDRGYALATFYYGDVDPDKRENDFTDGVHPHFFKSGQTEPGKHDWGAVAAWAYGVHRVIDFLEENQSTLEPDFLATRCLVLPSVFRPMRVALPPFGSASATLLM